MLQRRLILQVEFTGSGLATPPPPPIRDAFIMKPIITAFWGLAVLICLSWLAAEPTAPQASGLFPWRANMMQLTGLLAMTAMSVAMVLALRPRWLEGRLDGLDKMYRLHKWLGIAALSLGVVHYLWAKAPRWAVGLGLLERPQRGPRPPAASGIEQTLSSLRGLAESVGEWAFYAACLLIVLALVKRFPYRRFFQTHRLMALVYLVLVFHAAVLVKFPYWSKPAGVLMALQLVAGTVAAIIVLTRRVGAGRKVTGTITQIVDNPVLRQVEVRVDVAAAWPGHQAGQFAFVTFSDREGAHPFTIASAWGDGTTTLTFVIKALGDHTATLAATLTPGQEVTVEGPYGRFIFDDTGERQIWVGGGIGITPFLARLDALAATPRVGERPIDLFHCSTEDDPNGFARLRAAAERAGVRLHLLVDSRDGRLDGRRIRDAVPDWSKASLWFCGPAGFGHALARDFAAQGLNVDKRFHRELFQMR